MVHFNTQVPNEKDNSHSIPLDAPNTPDKIAQVSSRAWDNFVILSSAIISGGCLFVALTFSPLPVIILASIISGIAFLTFGDKLLTRLDVNCLLINYIWSSIIEVCLFCVVTLNYFTGLINTDPKPSLQNHDHAILLIHGYMHNRSAWSYLKWRLQTAGLGPIYTINLGSPFHSLEYYSELIQKKIAEIGAKEVSLVCHSMGGVVGSDAATQLNNPAIKIKKVITLNSPMQGTKLNVFAPGECARQMAYRANLSLDGFIGKLNKRITEAKNISFVHIGSWTDIIIKPFEAAFSDSADAKRYIFKRHGHIAPLFSPSVARLLIHELST